MGTLNIVLQLVTMHHCYIYFLTLLKDLCTCARACFLIDNCYRLCTASRQILTLRGALPPPPPPPKIGGGAVGDRVHLIFLH